MSSMLERELAALRSELDQRGPAPLGKEVEYAHLRSQVAGLEDELTALTRIFAALDHTQDKDREEKRQLGEIWNPFFHYDDGIHIPFLMWRHRIGDNIQSGCVIELYQLVINEVLDTVSQLETFLQGMPLMPKMVFALLR